MDFTVHRSSIAGESHIKVGLTGTGAAVPTLRAGNGITITRTAAAVYRVTFADNPGTWIGVVGCFLRAAAPAAVKNFSVTTGDYVPPAGNADGYIEISVWNGGGIATDLAAAQYLDITFAFSTLSRIK
jgi:hypothetical protein